MTQILRKGKPSHGGDRNTFELMASTKPPGTLESVASLLAATILSVVSVLLRCHYYMCIFCK